MKTEMIVMVLGFCAYGEAFWYGAVCELALILLTTSHPLLNLKNGT